MRPREEQLMTLHERNLVGSVGSRTDSNQTAERSLHPARRSDTVVATDTASVDADFYNGTTPATGIQRANSVSLP